MPGCAQPIQHDTGILAASALSVSGGHCSARVENVRIGEYVSVGAVSTQTGGFYSEGKRAWETFSRATIEKLNVLDVVTADRISVNLVSHHPVDASESSITPLAANFDNLRVAGCPVNVHIDLGLFSKLGSWSQLRGKVDSDQEFSRRIAAFGEDPKAGLEKGLIMCSLAGRIEIDCGDFKVGDDGSIDIPSFGKLHLAEFVMSPRLRRITMMRMTLGCPLEGDMACGDVVGNGHTYPP